ncbi:hypothetical protein CHCC20333_1385 [Bacillus paralicheniformis]|nr:hypothetical protein CHCC20333_1385 [Bacillus paralicheniformis]
MKKRESTKRLHQRPAVTFRFQTQKSRYVLIDGFLKTNQSEL